MEYLHHNFIFILVLTMFCFKAMSQQYQIMQYVLQWSPSFCQISNCKRGVSQKISIHGLWPAYGNGHSIPCKCIDIIKEEKNVNEVMKFNPNLNLFHIIWPNLKASSPYDWLWKHGWVNHGCCIGPSLTTTQYFQAGHLIIFSKRYINFFLCVLNGISINLTNHLVQGGVQPSNHVPYSELKIRAALSKLVHFSFDTKLTRFISCPLLQNGKCKTDVFLPTF
ncbi:hypothetical protein R3W88_030113 [Solanum pinnatisectum]|uniref:Uncharacterized protein n=1 Tax=Solanum pinnatisectum TaxID=50273 RepID=A0AAV9K7P2_9SOLN|nr:hypothetical protein R3W88_030113 [Solanum pinnatisectum]